MRVVIDANVVVSFLLTGGATLSEIVSLWEHKKFVILVSEEIILEIKITLERFVFRRLIKPQAASAILRRLKDEGEYVVTVSDVAVSRDEKDNRYLASAKDGRAEYLVSGDKDLLTLGKFARTKIISPKEFVKLLG